MAIALAHPTYSQNSPVEVDSIQAALSKLDNEQDRLELLLKSSASTYLKEPKQTMENGLEGLRLARKLKSNPHIHEALRRVAAVLFYAGNYDEAARLYGESLELATATGNQVEALKARVNINAIKLNNWKYSDALRADMLDILAQAEVYFEQSRDTTLITDVILSTYNNLSLLVQMDDRLDESFEYLDRGVEIAERYKVPMQKRFQLAVSRGTSYRNSGRFQEALAAFEEALGLSRASGERVLEATVLYYLGTTYHEMGNSDKALVFLLDGLAILEKFPNNPVGAELAEVVSEIYEQKGKSDLALSYSKQSKSYREKVKIEEASWELVRIELNQKFKELELSHAQERKGQMLRIYFWASMTLLVVGLLVFLYASAQRRYRFAQLEKMNLELEAQRLQLDKEFLQTELNEKDKKLASEVIQRMKHNEAIESVVSRLLLHQRKSKESGGDVIGNVVMSLKMSMDDQVWEEFDTRFQQVNADFYQKLHQINPDLTTNERRLCALFSLNLSSKEVQALTGKTQESLKKARLRLRQKLGLTHSDMGLPEYLSGL